MANLDVTSLSAQVLLFMASADFGYCIFVVANETFISVFVRAFRKADVPGHHIGKSGCRLENGTVSPILCCLHYLCKSFLFNLLWCHKLQWHHIRKKLICVRRECTFYWYI